MQIITRRKFLCSSALASVGAASLSLTVPRVLFAAADTDSRFVFIILRGALDGLAAVPPYGDGSYARMRGELAIAAPGAAESALKLDGTFALHPSLIHLHERYVANELVVLHAIASPYRERSHFDGQDLLENGTLKPHGADDGWLNRALAALPASRMHDSEKFAMAFSQNIPLVMRGTLQVGSWVPSKMPETDTETLQRIADMYAGNTYFSSRLQSAIAADAVADSKDSHDDMNGSMNGRMNGSGRRDPLGAVGVIAAAAGRMLRAAEGPRVAVIETLGWDTHANQGAERGVLANRLSGLDNAIDSLRVELGDAWKKTAVIVATEFGRTVAVNGTRGTDHGTGTCAFLVGGAVKGGRIVADWPGLNTRNLYQARDLQPTHDLRSVFKGVLGEHLDVSEAQLESKIFPESHSAKAMSGLLRKA